MTKQLILEKALALFTDKGYEGSSMDDIAKAVGIRKGLCMPTLMARSSIDFSQANGAKKWDEICPGIFPVRNGIE